MRKERGSEGGSEPVRGENVDHVLADGLDVAVGQARDQDGEMFAAILLDVLQNQGVLLRRWVRR